MADNGMNIQQNLFEAIYNIAKGVVEQQSFDITKECRIIEVVLDMRGNPTGEYKVKSQDAIYTAYARDGDIYAMDEMVYVQIPNGDYNNDKFIIGRKSNKDAVDSAYNLKMPFDDLLGFYNLTQNNQIKQKGYRANDPNHGINGLLSPQNSLTNSINHIWHWTNLNKESIYATKLGIGVDITTLLHNFDVISGSYGLRVVLKGLSTESIELGESVERTRDFLFSSKDMYGNPYAYNVPTTQQLIVDISDFARLDSVDVWFWQDYNFVNQSGEKIPYEPINVDSLNSEMESKISEILSSNLTQEERDIRIQQIMNEYSERGSSSTGIENIYFENLEILLGISVDEINEEKLVALTYDQLTYGDNPNSALVQQQERTLRAVWIHTIDGALKLIDTYGELKSADAEIFWYKYDSTWGPGVEGFDAEENVSHRLGGFYWRPIEDNKTHIDTDKLQIEVIPDKEKSEQRYKAIVWFSNTYAISNILTFTNFFDIEAESANPIKSDAIILQISALNENQTNLSSEDALNNFFVYNENNKVLTNDNNQKFSDIKYYIEPWIKVQSEDGYQYQRLSEYRDTNDEYYDITIDWDFPQSYTMFSQIEPINRKVEENIPYWSNRWNHGDNLLADRDCATTCYFKIKDVLDYRYVNNTIGATITANTKVFNVRLNVLFGRAMDLGCEYVPVLKITTPSGNSYVQAGNSWNIECSIYDRYGKELHASEIKDATYNWKIYSENNIYRVNPSGNTCSGVVNGDGDPFVIECTIRGVAEYPITSRRGILVLMNSGYNSYNFICPDRVEFRSDGQTPLFYTGALEVYSSGNNLLNSTWSSSNIKICSIEERQQTVLQEEAYYNDGTIGIINAPPQYYMKMASMTKNSIPQWDDRYLDNDYFTYLICLVNDSIVAKQAIAFAMNTYPSSLVNQWNGTSLSIDEENAAIIGQMFAAGTKNSKNQFSGIMMGDWSPKGDNSLDTPGIYGLQNGVQSFGFKNDGTGFLGRPGYGRIEFDGRNALITNPENTCYINLNPYTLSKNNSWNTTLDKGYSQFFLYCQAPKANAEFDSESSNWASQLDRIWGKKFINDNDNDYFIVDPNNGVLTSGGIIATYGRIGKENPWIIHDYGLTQKNNFGTIFLGNPEKNFLSGPSSQPSFEAGGTKNEGNYFSIAVGTSNRIKTGIRPDGYFYTEYATIGDWYITNKELYVGSERNSEFRTKYDADGYKQDAINISASHKFISFDEGRMIINGNYGWMGYYSDGTIENKSYYGSNGPDAYDMFINFRSKFLGMGKELNGKPQFSFDGNKGEITFFEDNFILNTKNGWMSFFDNRFVINGKDGWIAFHKNGYSSIGTNPPRQYGMLIDFNDSKICFGKPNDNGYDAFTYIDGANGVMSFNHEKFMIDGENGWMASYRSKLSAGTTPINYNMLVDFEEGKIGFGARNDNPFTLIDGNNGAISLNHGHMIIDSEHGWMGFYKNGALDYTDQQTPDTYNMLIELASGTINFGKNIGQSYPASQISGTDGSAYFANGQIQFAAKDGIIYCGVPSFNHQFNGFDVATEGKLYLADILLRGITSGISPLSYQYKYASYSKNTEFYQGDSDNTIREFITDGFETLPEDGYGAEESQSFLKLDPLQTQYETIQGGVNEAYENLGNSGIFTIGYDSGNITGFNCYIDNEKSIALAPTGNAKGYLYNWDLHGSYADIETLFVNQARINTLYCVENNETCLIATQPWVMENINKKIWPKVVDVNNLAAEALDNARSAIKTSRNAINAATRNRKEIKDLVDTSVSTLRHVDSGSGVSHTIEIIGDKVGGGGITNTILPSLCDAMHYHNDWLELSGNGVLTVRAEMPQERMDTKDGINLGNVVINLSGDSSDGKLSWSTLGGNSGNFNIADTAFYKKGAFESAKTKNSLTINSYVEVTFEDGHTQTCDPNHLEISDDGTRINQVNSDGEIVASYNIASINSSNYNDGYSAGWRAAYNTFSYTTSGDYVTVTGPSSSQGNTQTHSIQASAVGSNSITLPISGSYYTNTDGSAFIKRGDWDSGTYYKTLSVRYGSWS